VKRTTYDFHARNAFAHRFDLRKQGAVNHVNPDRRKECALSPRLRAQG
jgi:hypothetical protein